MGTPEIGRQIGAETVRDLAEETGQADFQEVWVVVAVSETEAL